MRQGLPPFPSAVQATLFTCPKHVEIQLAEPGACPKCGMALEAISESSPVTPSELVCPMHPETVRNEPGNCPIRGMALEQRNVAIEDENQEFKEMTRRFWISVVLALPVFVLAMVHDLVLDMMPAFVSIRQLQWIEFALASPVVLWCGWPFFQRGWAAVVNRSLNMFTLIALGVPITAGVSYPLFRAIAFADDCGSGDEL